MSMVLKKNLVFFPLLFVTILLIFRNAFQVSFFSDDFSFLSITKIHSLNQFITFFIPGKNYFYRPIPTELFYFLIHVFNNSLLFARCIVFGTYFVGLYFFYKNILTLTKNDGFAKLATVIYSVHFTHVFQLYYLATFQEIALFTFLNLSFYFYVKKTFLPSILFFIFSLMSKEIALVYPVFLTVYTFFYEKDKRYMQLIYYFVLSGIFLFIYKHSLTQVSELEIYKIQLSPRLIINNMIWYFMWGLGFSNVMPDYFMSITKPPNPAFWQLFNDKVFLTYFISLCVYWAIAIIGYTYLVITDKKKVQGLQIGLLTIVCFFIFLLPVLPIIHRWMVRLTMPVIFVTLFQAYIWVKLFKKNQIGKIATGILVALYVIWNFCGVAVHENTSLYFLETSIIHKTATYITQHKDEIMKHQTVYFADEPENKGKAFLTSEKLFTSFSDQSFLHYFLPNSHLKVVYNFKAPIPPPNSYIIHSIDLVR